MYTVLLQLYVFACWQSFGSRLPLTLLDSVRQPSDREKRDGMSDFSQSSEQITWNVFPPLSERERVWV